MDKGISVLPPSLSEEGCGDNGSTSRRPASVYKLFSVFGEPVEPAPGETPVSDAAGRSLGRGAFERSVGPGHDRQVPVCGAGGEVAERVEVIGDVAAGIADELGEGSSKRFLDRC